MGNSFSFDGANVILVLGGHYHQSKVDRHGKIVPWLAERWHTSDNRNSTFFLKKGVRFHNGRELRAADVKSSFERAARGKRPWVFEKITGARDVIAGRTADMAGVRVVDACEWQLMQPPSRRNESLVFCRSARLFVTASRALAALASSREGVIFLVA